MANQKDLQLLERGIVPWNSARSVVPDLSNADLSGKIFKGEGGYHGSNYAELFASPQNQVYPAPVYANLSKTNFRGSNLNAADLSHANLSEATFNIIEFSQLYAKYDNVYQKYQEHEAWINNESSYFSDMMSLKNDYTDELSEINKALLSSRVARQGITSEQKTTLVETNLWYANLRGADLGWAYCKNADFRHANLSEVNAIGTNFQGANLTGACIANWIISDETNFESVICDHIYLEEDGRERRPLSGAFDPGEFAILIQRILSTIDLIFTNGINWGAFFEILQELQAEHMTSDLSLKSIEKKGDQAFVIRLDVNSKVDRANLEKRIKNLYEEKIRVLEARYNAEIKAKDSEIIEIYKQKSIDMMDITKLYASKPSLVVGTVAMSENQNLSSTNQFESVGIVNTSSVTVQGNQIGIENNYVSKQKLNEAFQEIQQLWEQFAKQHGSHDEEQFAQNLAHQAQQNSTFKQKLAIWGNQIAGISTQEAAKVAGGEVAKRVVPKALAFLVSLL